MLMAYFGFAVAAFVAGIVCRLAYCELRDTFMYGGKRGDWCRAAVVTALASAAVWLTIYFNPFTNTCGC